MTVAWLQGLTVMHFFMVVHCEVPGGRFHPTVGAAAQFAPAGQKGPQR